MVVAIVFIACFFGFLKTYMDSRKHGTDSDELAETNERLAQMEDRIRVLEKIVTDSGSSLRREIDNLR
jgi:site-specific recombinase